MFIALYDDLGLIRTNIFVILQSNIYDGAFITVSDLILCLFLYFVLDSN